MMEQVRNTAVRPVSAQPSASTEWLKDRGVLIVMHIVLTLVAIFMMLPFVWMLSTSFKPQNEIFTRPPLLLSPNMNLDGYRFIIDAGVLNALLNTFYISISFTVLALFFCALGGYGFAKFQFPGRKMLFFLLLGTMMVPAAVTMLPSYIIMQNLKWINTFNPLIVPGAANAFGIFFMRQYISTVNNELLDAARIDGCGEFGVFRRVVLPIVTPGLLSLGLIFFMSSWNNFLGPLIYLKSPDYFTLPLFMTTLQGPPGFSAYREWMGVAVISVVPLLVIFLVLQRRFIEGITSGAVKG
jgi:ABC-type glycerol-3-phosphate transport system permease component